MSYTDIKIQTQHNFGDMSLCNLASINLLEFRRADDKTKDLMAKTIVHSLDAAISNGKCPISEGNITNHLYRYLGIGVMNAANAMASEGIVIDTPDAAEFWDQTMDDLAYRLYFQSMELAKELGRFPEFGSTKWAEGLTPVHMSRQFFPKAWELTTYGRNFQNSGRLEKWEELGQLIKHHGIRNATLLAVAPTASSAKAINCTESTEPVMGLMFKEEGTMTVPSLAPNISENAKYYKNAFDCDQYALVTNAIIRQKYVDQAQSLTVYLKKVDSLKELTKLHNYGFEHGIKTFYYSKQLKPTQNAPEEECVACAV